MPQQTIRLFLMDIDGTLVDDSARISRKTIQALEEARERGITLAILTGRKEPDLDFLFRQMDFQGYVGCNGGAKLFHRGTGEILLDAGTDWDAVCQVTAFALREGLLVNLLAGGKWYITRRHPSNAHYSQAFGISPTPITDVSQLQKNPVQGFFTHDEPERFARYIEEHQLPLRTAFAGKGIVDILPAGLGKREAAQVLADHLNLSPKQVAAIGNYDNDLGMLTFAGLGIAVANAPDSLKARVSAVTRATNNESAVAEALHRFVFNR